MIVHKDFDSYLLHVPYELVNGELLPAFFDNINDANRVIDDTFNDNGKKDYLVINKHLYELKKKLDLI